MKVSAAPKIFAKLVFSQLELDVTEMELYQDWSRSTNVYGRLNIPVPVQSDI